MTQSPQTLTPDEVQGFADIAARVGSNVASVVLGKPEVVRLALTGLFAEGHLLIEDVPGRRQDHAGPGDRGLGARASGGASSSRPTCCRPT